MTFVVRSSRTLALATLLLVVACVGVRGAHAATVDPTPSYYLGAQVSLGINQAWDDPADHIVRPLGVEFVGGIEMSTWSGDVPGAELRIPFADTLDVRLISDGDASCSFVARLLSCSADVDEGDPIEIRVGITPNTAGTTSILATTWATSGLATVESGSVGFVVARGAVGTTQLELERSEYWKPLRHRASDSAWIPWRVTNLGPSTTNAQFVLDLADADSTTISVLQAGGCARTSATRATCTLTGIPANEQRTLNIRVEGFAPGSVAVTATVTPTGGITHSGPPPVVAEQLDVLPASAIDLQATYGDITHSNYYAGFSAVAREANGFPVRNVVAVLTFANATVDYVDDASLNCVGFGTSTITCAVGDTAADAYLDFGGGLTPTGGAITATMQLTSDVDSDLTNNDLVLVEEIGGGGGGSSVARVFTASAFATVDDASPGTGSMRVYVYAPSGAGLSGTTLRVQLPTDVTVPVPGSVTGGGACTTVAGDLHCALPSLAAGQSTTVNIPISVAAGSSGNRSMRASIHPGSVAGQQLAADRGSIFIDNLDDATSRVDIRDASIGSLYSGWGIRSVATVGAHVDASLRVRMSGGSPSTGTSVRIVLPAGLDPATAVGEVDDDSTRPCSRAGRVLTCPIGTMTDGESVSIDVRALALTPGFWTITTSVVGATVRGPVSTATNLDFDVVGASTSDLMVTASVMSSDITSSEVAVEVRNHARVDAASAVATITLPPGYAASGFVASQGSCSGTTTVTCSLGTVPAHHVSRVVFDVSIPASSPGGQLASIVAAYGGVDAAPDDNSTVLLLRGSSLNPDYGMDPLPRHSVVRLQAGGHTRQLTFSGQNENVPESAALLFEVATPTGVRPTSAAGLDWACTNPTAQLLRCAPTTSYVPSYFDIPVSFEALPGVQAGDVIARVIASGDVETANDTVRVPVVLEGTGLVDLSARMIAPTRSKAVAERGRIQLVARNDSAIPAEDTTVSVTLPVGVVLDRSGADGGSCTAVGAGPTVVTCPLGDIWPGEYLYASLLVYGTVGGVYALPMTASSATTEIQPDDNDASGTLRVRALGATGADVSARYDGDTCDIDVGASCTIRVWVDNDGPGSVTGSAFDITPPAGTTITSIRAHGSACSVVAGAGACSLAQLDAGESIGVDVVLRGDIVTAGAAIARVVPGGTADPETGGNEQPVAVLVGAAIPASTGTSAVNLTTRLIQFGSVPVGAHADQPVTLTAEAGGGITLRAPSIVGAQSARFSLGHDCPTFLPGGASCTLTVRFAPIAQAGSVGTLLIRSASGANVGAVNLSGAGGTPTGITGGGGSTQPPTVAPPITAKPPTNIVTGTPRADTFRGTPLADVFRGLAHNDVLWGGGGNDRLSGDAGHDRISGGYGADVLNGGSGNDIITGGPGRDRIMGGTGNDTIRAKDGARDIIDCGAGRDLVQADRMDIVANCERRRK